MGFNHDHREKKNLELSLDLYNEIRQPANSFYAVEVVGNMMFQAIRLVFSFVVSREICILHYSTHNFFSQFKVSSFFEPAQQSKLPSVTVIVCFSCLFSSRFSKVSFANCQVVIHCHLHFCASLKKVIHCVYNVSS